MESEIKELVKKEQTWLNYLKSWGCNPDTAKDLVQELYITINSWLKKHNKSLMYNDNEVNWYYVYVTLRNLFLDLKRQEAKVKIISLDNSDKIKASLIVEQYQEIEDDKFEKHKCIEEWLLNDDFIEMTKDSEVFDFDRYDKNKMFNYYQRKVFEEIFIHNKSISQLSRDTNISYYSLYNTVKNIKEQINKFYESKNWG